MASVSPEQLLLSAFGLFTVGALVSIGGRSWRRTGYTSVAFAAAASVALWILAAGTIVRGETHTRAYLGLGAIGASLTFRIDRLSSVFLLVVPFIGLAALLYSVEYMNHVHGNASARRYYPFALLMLASITGVITTSNLLYFFVFWELMTLTSWALVWFDREDETKVRAAWQYFVATHVAAACMLVAILVIYTRSGSFAFADVSSTVGAMLRTSPALVHVVIALFVIGFATKAGMFPLGGWLPQAYPAAPSPASAAFAGSMTKLGIYGIVRVLFEFFRVQELTTVWGGIIATLGALSIFVGTLTALREDDAKRVLSYHIIGQIGYMLLGVGTAAFFLRSVPALAAVALIAGLYHVVNHACYKSLLFLNVGAAEYQTGTRDLNKMGGLGALMPTTMAAAIIASLSIAGIPPFSGFVSKWLIYQSTIQGGLRVPLFLVFGLVAMFISLVTLASFMKLIGAMFLGKLSTAGKTVTGDVPISMRIPQLVLSAACVLLGVAPILPLLLLYKVAQDVLGSTFVSGYAALFGSNPSGITLRLGNEIVGAWNPAYALAALAICALLAYAISRSAHAPARETASWYGGEEYADDVVRFRAHGFVLPFKQAFAKVYPSVRLPKIQTIGFMQKVLNLDTWLYGPIVNAGSRLTDGLSRTHSGIPHVYMLWQVIGIAVVFAVLFILLK